MDRHVHPDTFFEAPQEGSAEFGEVTILAFTARAIRVLCHDLTGAPSLWVPRSVVLADSEPRKKGDRGIMVVRPWFAKSVTDRHRPSILEAS